MSNQVIVRYFFNAEYVERTHQKLPERPLTRMDISQKFEDTRNDEKL